MRSRISCSPLTRTPEATARTPAIPNRATGREVRSLSRFPRPLAVVALGSRWSRSLCPGRAASPPEYPTPGISEFYFRRV